jgi:hypothetical protein
MADALEKIASAEALGYAGLDADAIGSRDSRALYRRKLVEPFHTMTRLTKKGREVCRSLGIKYEPQA